MRCSGRWDSQRQCTVGSANQIICGWILCSETAIPNGGLSPAQSSLEKTSYWSCETELWRRFQTTESQRRVGICAARSWWLHSRLEKVLEPAHAEVIAGHAKGCGIGHSEHNFGDGCCCDCSSADGHKFSEWTDYYGSWKIYLPVTLFLVMLLTILAHVIW